MDSIQRLTDNEVRDSIQTLAETGSTNVRGSSVTVYGLQPVLFLKQVVDAAKNEHFFIPFCNEIDLAQGTHQISIPKRTKYLGRAGMSFDTTERTSADVTFTQMSNVDNVSAIPLPYYAGYSLQNYALRVNAVNLLQFAKDELSYAIGDQMDRIVATTIGDATISSNSVNGAQTLYGGDAKKDNELAAGDVITTDLVAKGARYLKQTDLYYWTGGTETLSAVTKNPWQPTSDEPFVLFIGPAQEETFRKDSQFVNAAEYGSNKVISNGEIGEYLGIKIIVSNNVENVASGGTSPDGVSTATAGTNMTRCIMLKAKKACAVVYGQRPTIKVFDYPSNDSTRILLTCAFLPVVVHADAIVYLDVAQA